MYSAPVILVTSVTRGRLGVALNLSRTRASAHEPSAEHHLDTVVIVPRGLATRLGEARCGTVLLEESHAQVAHRGHDRRGVTIADTTGVLAEDHIQAPVRSTIPMRRNPTRRAVSSSVRRSSVIQ